MTAAQAGLGFVDTKVLVYAFTTDVRAAKAEALLARGCVTSVQGLNEFTNVARRKLGMSWDEVTDALAAIRVVCRSIRPVDLETHEKALSLAQRHGLAIFDALMVASALGASCDVFWSEDLHDGLAIDGRIRIVNPFREDL